MCEGIAAELGSIDLGDERLNSRAGKMIEAMAADSQASVNAAMPTWSETKAAYRLFDNPKVTPEKILEPHQSKTRERIADEPVVLLLQDTTEIDLKGHPPEDARCLDREFRHGFYNHTHLAVTPEGVCLGVLGLEFYDRDPACFGKSKAEKKRREALPIEEKESYRWLKGYRLACQLQGENPDTSIVSVADREADIYDIYREAREHVTAADFVIRARSQHQRYATPVGKNVSTTDEVMPTERVLNIIQDAKVRYRREMSLTRTSTRKARVALLEIRVARVELHPPQDRKNLGKVILNVVDVREINLPDDNTAVSWTLYTSLPIESISDIDRVIDYYASRWTIEVYFRTLKTGCRVEQLQLEKLSRLYNCLSFYAIIAWRTMQLTHLSRENPTLPVNAVFDDAEWMSVWQIVKKTPPPAVPPTLSEFVPILATLGGYNNRASDPPPGPQCIWMALRRMTDFALAWLTFAPQRE